MLIVTDSMGLKSEWDYSTVTRRSIQIDIKKECHVTWQGQYVGSWVIRGESEAGRPPGVPMEGYQASRGPMYPNQSAQGPNEVVKVLPVHPTLHLTSTVTPHVLDILPWCFLDSRQDIGISLKAALWGRLINCLNRKLSMQSQLFKLKKTTLGRGQ